MSETYSKTAIFSNELKTINKIYRPTKHKNQSKGKNVEQCWERNHEKFGHNACNSCAKPLDRITNLAVIDHIIPRSIGGDNIPENIQLLCLACNKNKTVLDIRVVNRMKKEKLELNISQLEIIYKEEAYTMLVEVLTERYNRDMSKARELCNVDEQGRHIPLPPVETEKIYTIEYDEPLSVKTYMDMLFQGKNPHALGRVTNVREVPKQSGKSQ